MDDCIEFQGCKSTAGYGIKCIDSKKFKAHRIAYCKAKNIDIKDIDGLVVMHVCDNPPCVNPAHLVLGTQKENIDDMMKKGRHGINPMAKGETHGKAKITSADVFKIREMVKFKTQKEVGKMFGVSHKHVGRIARGERWAHLTEQQSIGGGDE